MSASAAKSVASSSSVYPSASGTALIVRYGLIAAVDEAAIHGVRVSLRLDKGHYLLADLGIVRQAVQVFQ